jgi:hypothetical protein
MGRDRRLVLVSLAALAALALLPGAAAAEAKTVWLCKPGLEDDACDTGLTTTTLSPSGEPREIKNVKRAKRRRFDCFYVYPTVSDQTTPNANLDIDPEQRSIALYQAARYTQICRVFAPVYRQLTLGAIGDEVTPEMAETAYSGVRDAWRAYLRKHNDGRGVVLIGHSQGTFMLEELVAEEIEPRRSLRRRLISAILLGGDITVAEGEDHGGSFDRIGACRSEDQVGCVIAFSTFNAPVPAEAAFGRTTAPGEEVLCTNPAALGDGSGALRAINPSEPFAPGTTIGLGVGLIGAPSPAVSTSFLESRGAYSGECSSADGADVLQISAAAGAPALNPVPSPSWGLHLLDANIALGNLVELVRGQARTFAKAR